MQQDAVPPLRKADFWTGLILIAVAFAMLLESLTFPLRGTYAGVRNAWYVSPALMPLITAGLLLALAGLLLANAIRTGGAAAALADARGLVSPAAFAQARDPLLIGGLIAGYVVGLLPYVDFVAATTLFLLAFTIAYHVEHRAAALPVVLGFFALALLGLALAVLGLQPSPRTAAAYRLDLVFWLAVVVLVGLARLRLVREDRDARRKLAIAIAVSLLTPVVLAVMFKYGLRVPLPREGVTVELFDTVRYTLRGAG